VALQALLDSGEIIIDGEPRRLYRPGQRKPLTDHALHRILINRVAFTRRGLPFIGNGKPCRPPPWLAVAVRLAAYG